MPPRRPPVRAPVSTERAAGIKVLEGRLDYRWKQRGILLQALRHPSSTSDGRRANRLGSNQRLEFLGDSVLDMVVGMYLMSLHPDADEGFLATTRAKIVNQKALAMRGKNLGIDALVEIEPNSDYLRTQESTIADCLEAIIGSAFVDAEHSFEVAHRVIKNAGVLG